MAYDFTYLDPIEFEQLVCDILSKKYSTHVESFSPGPDSGIDLRYTCPESKKTVIVQCKRYSEGGYSSLKSKLKLELEKLEKLKPEQYKLVTSIPLTPGNKKELFEILKPWCTSEQDILGKNDLNSMLDGMEEIIKKHFKLWLTSSLVLDQIINAKIFNFSTVTLENIKKELGKLVIHDGLSECLEILNKNNHVLIAGDPGVGKTTLANMISYKLTTEGYESVFVNSDVAEAWSVLHKANDPEKKLLLVYDDFLGRFELNSSKLSKNEDKQIIELIKKCEMSKNIKLILTTREYILEDAKQKNGTLSEHANEIEKFVVKIENYTKEHKGRILFNHLYFSNLPENRLEIIVNSRIYREIIEHKNYNPRIIESICIDANSKHLSDDDFITFIKNTLKNPSLVWQQPFDREISDIARMILLMLASFNGEANIEDIKDSIINIIEPKFKLSFEQEFKDSHKQIEGNFIITKRREIYNETEYICEFGNPSIEEFITHIIRRNPELILHISSGINFYNQAVNLYSKILTQEPPNKKKRQALAVIEKKLKECNSNFYYKSSRSFFGPRYGWYPHTFSKFSQLLHELSIRTYCGEVITESELEEMTRVSFWTSLIKNSPAPANTMSELFSLTEWLLESDIYPDSKKHLIEESIRKAILDSGFLGRAIDDMEDIENFYNAITRINGALTKEEEDALYDVFIDNIKVSLLDDEDIDNLENAISVLEETGIDKGGVEYEIQERIEQIETEIEREDERRSTAISFDREEKRDSFDIDDLFNELLER